MDSSTNSNLCTSALPTFQNLNTKLPEKGVTLIRVHELEVHELWQTERGLRRQEFMPDFLFRMMTARKTGELITPFAGAAVILMMQRFGGAEGRVGRSRYYSPEARVMQMMRTPPAGLSRLLNPTRCWEGWTCPVSWADESTGGSCRL